MYVFLIDIIQFMNTVKAFKFNHLKLKDRGLIQYKKKTKKIQETVQENRTVQKNSTSSDGSGEARTNRNSCEGEGE